jgi:hypothetical protein
MSESRYLRTVCLPQLRQLHREAQERYVFLMQVHQTYRHAYVRLSYWTSWLGVVISIVSTAQQIILAVGATFSTSTAVSGFVVNTLFLLVGLVIRENTKTIQSSSQFSQSINEQVYQFADLTTDTQYIAKQLQSAITTTTTMTWGNPHDDINDEAAVSLAMPTIAEMNDTLVRFSDGLNHATMTTTRLIETFDSDLPTIGGSRLCTSIQKNLVTFLCFWRRQVKKKNEEGNEEPSKQMLLARWNQVVTYRSALKRRRLSTAATAVVCTEEEEEDVEDVDTDTDTNAQRQQLSNASESSSKSSSKSSD